MSFLSILFALLFEQLKPLRADNRIYEFIRALAVRLETGLNAGKMQHGRTAWFVMMAALMVPTALVYWLCLQAGPLAAFVCNVAVLYLTLGFRHYSHFFTSIQIALNAGDEASARSLLAEWTKLDTSSMDVTEISRVAVGRALITSHRNVFGVFFWFLMPFGPACAVMYRLAEYLARAWNEPEHMQSEVFGRFATRAFYWIDFIPARLTALAFAIVGNFEDAIYSWRNFAERWHDESVGIILSAGGGAMGVRLGAPQQDAANLSAVNAEDGELLGIEIRMPPGDESTARALQSTVALVWRALLLWMLLLLLLSAALWLG